MWEGVPRPGIEPAPRQQPEPLQGQCWIFNLLSHKGNLILYLSDPVKLSIWSSSSSHLSFLTILFPFLSFSFPLSSLTYFSLSFSTSFSFSLSPDRSSFFLSFLLCLSWRFMHSCSSLLSYIFLGLLLNWGRTTALHHHSWNISPPFCVALSAFLIPPPFSWLGPQIGGAHPQSFLGKGAPWSSHCGSAS